MSNLFPEYDNEDNTARVNKILSGFQQDTIDDGKNTGIAGDLVDVAQAGVIGGFADIARGATLGSENAVSKGLRDWSNSQYDTITPESIDAINNTGINDDLSIKDGSSLRGAALLATQGIGSIVPSFTPGLAIGSALNKIGKVGTLTGAVQRGVRSLNSAIGHGAGGALMIGGNTANQVQNEIMQAPLEQLANSEDFKNLYWKYRDSNKSEAESVNLARAEYADIKAQEGFNKGAPIGAVSMGLGNPVIEKLAKGGGASRLGSAIAGAVTEGGQEFGEGYGQQVAANEIAQDYDINRPTNKDAVSQGATGAVIGAGIGGAIGGIGYRPNAVDKQDKSKDDTTQQSNNDKFINRDGLVDTSLRDSIDKQFENRISANDLAIGLDERTAQLKRKRNEYSKQDDINRAYESLDLQKQQDINKAKYDGEFNSAQYLADIVRNKTPKMQQALDAKKGGEHIFNTQMADQLEAIRTETAQEKQGLSREALSNFNRGVDSSPANEIDNTNIMQGAINANSAVNNFKSSLNNPTEPNTSGLQDGINPQQVISELNDQKTKEQQIDEAFNSRQSSNKESDFAKFANEKGLNKSERKAVRKFMVKNKLNRSARKKFIDSLNNPTDNFGGVNDDTRSLLNKAITQAKEYSTSGEAENNQLALALQKALGKTNEKSTIKTTGSTTKDTNNEQKQGDRQLISNAGDNSLNGRVIDKKRSNDRPEPNGQDKPVITNDVALSDKQEELPISQQKSGSDNSGSGKATLNKTTIQLQNEQSKQAKDEKKNEEATAQRGSASGVNNGSSKLKGKKLPNLTTKESIEINSYKNINTGFVRARFGRDKITESQAQDIVDNHIYTPIEKEPIAQPKKNKEKAAINFNTNKSEGFKVGENAKAIDGKGAASGVVTAIRNTPNGTFISTSDTSLLDEEKQYHSINKFHNESEVKQDSKKAVKTAGQTNLELKIDKKTKKTSLNKSKEPVLDDVDSKHSQGNDEFNKYKDGVIKEFNGLRVAPVMYNPRRKLGKQTSSRLEASEVATKLRREGYTVSGMSPDIPSDAKILEVFNKTRNEESKTIPVPPNNKSDNATNGVVATKATDGGSVSGKEEVSPDASSDQKPTNNKATNPTDIKTSPIRDENTEKKSSKNIDDFGEKLGGAKKDIARRMTDEVKQMSDDEIASLPLSKIFPKKQIDNTEDKFSAAYLTVLREIIPSKPRKSYLVKSWVSKIKNVMGLVNMIETIPPTKILDKMRDSSALGLGDFANKIELLMNIDRESWTRIGGISDYSKAYSYDDNGNKVSSTAFYVEIDGKRNRVDGATKLEDTYSSVKQLLESAVESKRIPFEIRGRSGEYFINKKGDKEYRSLKSFTSLDDARKYKNENYDDLVKSWEATKDRDNVKRSDMRSKENRPRTGKDYRTGKDVSEDDFSKAFGFRGVEFGKWVKQGKSGKDRQGLLNQAYDALMDLSNILNIPSQAISLNGSLGLGLGSRGSGNASAHFEPSTIVINLTKTKGAGSLAHEWFHALDNYFSRMRDSEVNVNKGLNAQQHHRMNSYITYRPEPMYRHKTQPFGLLTRSELAYRRKRNPNSVYKSEDWELDRSHPKGVRHEVESKFAELVEALDDSPMRLRAGRNDKSSTDGYWSRIIERGARSFENYVISKMQKSGYDNDFLANVVSIEKFARSPERYPYLLAEEMQPVESAFDNLFKTLKTKKTDEGTALYSKNTKTTGSTVQQIKDMLPRRVKKMLGNGLEVVQSVSDLPKSLQAKATDDIQGLYDPATDTTYLIADMLNKDNTLSVLSHELLHKRLANDPKLKAQLDSTKAGLRDIFDKVQDGTYKGRYKKLYDEALDRVKSANTSTDDVTEEFIAYTVEIFNTKPQTLPAKLKQLIQKLIATIKMVLRRAGFPVTKITPADLNSLAMQAVGKASVNPSTSNLVALASKQGYKGTDKIEAKEWLEAIADGLDMSHDARMKRAKDMGFDVDTVYYHGTRAKFNNFKRGKTTGNQGETDQIEGIYFTDSKDGAEFYSDYPDDTRFLKKVFLAFNNPYTVENKNELKNELKVNSLGDVTNTLEDMEFDSLIIERGFYSNGGPYKEAIAFHQNQIRSINAAFNPKNKDSGNLLASYAGKKAKTADNSALAKAVQMEQGGISNETIRKETGWFLGLDDNWRFEIDDSKADFVYEEGFEGNTYLSEVLYHESLYKSYPTLRNIPVNFVDGIKGGYGGFFYDDEITIDINAKNKKSIILHEIQHYIQGLEGFARGGTKETAREELDSLIKALRTEKIAPVSRINQYERAAKIIQDIDHKRRLVKTFERWRRNPESIKKYSEWFTRSVYGVPRRSNKNNDREEFFNKIIEDEITKKLRKLYPTLSAQNAEIALNEYVNDKEDRRLDLVEAGKITRKFSKDYPDYHKKLSDKGKRLSRFETRAKYNSNYTLYKSLAGEIEARDTQHRIDFTPEQRKAEIPYESQGISKEDAIVKLGDGVAQSIKFSKSYTDKVANAFSKEKLDEGIDKENTEEYGILNEKLGKIGELATKYLTTLDNLARNNPVARPFLDMVKLMQMKKDELLSKTNEAVVAYNNIGDTGISHFFTSMYDAEKSKSVQQKRLDRALFSGTINEEVFNDNKLKEQFKLNDKAIESYKKIRSYMDDMTKEYQDALLKRMGIKRDGEKLTLINQTGKAKDADILASGHNLIKEFKGLTGYFPLMRFGKHTITVKDEEGKIVYFSAEESAKKAIIAANKIKREFDKEIGQYKVSTGLLADTSRDDLAFDPRLLNMLGKYQEQIPGFSDVFDSVEQDILKNFSSSEFKKRFIHRKGTEGYSTDTSRTLASYGWSSSNYISKMLHVPEIQTYIDNDVNKHENPKTLEHLQKTLDYIKTPSNEYQAIKSFTFMYYMGANVKSAFVNLTQIPVTLGPFLANKFGDANTARSITKSMKLAKKEQAILNKDSKGNVIKDVEYYLAWAEKEGLTFDSYLGDLIGAATGKRQAQARVANKALEKLTLMFSKAEMFNRRVSVASAYLLTKDMGLSDINNMLTESGHNAQINKEFAIKEFSKLTVTKTQFDYCVDTKTQCMTNKGWVNYYSLSIGDHIYAVDDDLKLVDSKVDNVNIFKGKKQIIEFSGGQGFSMAVTDNHDCLVQNYNSRDKKWQGVRKVKAGDLKNSQHILRVHKGYENNKEVFNDDEIKLFSWIAAEGWYAKFRNCKNKNNVRVAQSVSYNPKYVKDIEGILDRLGGHYSKHTYKRKQGDVIATFSLRKPLSSIVLKAMPDKLITNKLVNSMSARQMKIFIDVFVDADGNVVGKHRRISQKSKQNLDMLQMMCTITGTNASIVDYDAISELSIKCNSRTFVKQLKREIKTVNTVWCPETKEGTWIARRNGQVFLTGNSKFNRPAAFRGWGSVPLQFNQFMINYLQFIAGNGGGIGASVRSLGAVFLFAGLTGLPGADDLRAALEYAYTKITGKHIDINMESRKALVDMSKSFMGDEMAKNFAEAVLYGGSTLTPLDVSGSIGTGRVVPGLGDFFDTAKDKGELAGFSRFIMGASGATAGIARKTFRGIEEYNLSGDVTRALEKAPVIPIAIQNALKAVRMATTGVDRNYAGKVSIEYHPTLIDTIAQALSFTPGERKRLYRQRNVNYRESEFLKMAHKKLLIRLSSAIADGDAERVREARQVIVEWNRDVPLKWRLSRDKVNRSIRRRMKNFNSASKNNNRALKRQFIENERYFTI